VHAKSTDELISFGFSQGRLSQGVGRAISHIFKSGGGVEGLDISTNMWRLDRQTDTRKVAISDVSKSTYAKVTDFYRLLLVVT